MSNKKGDEMVLLTPGPVEVEERIRMASAKKIIHHRTKEYTQMYERLVEISNKLFDSNETHILAGTGTLANEMALFNMLEKNKKVLCLDNGEFSERIAKTASYYSDNVIVEKIEWGKGFDKERIKEKIDNEKPDVVAVVQNETSTAVSNKIDEICRYAKDQGAMTFVDAVSCWPAQPASVKKHKIDAIATASQKALSCPPGLALLSISDEMVEVVEKREKQRGTYLDLKPYRKKWLAKHQNPTTPAVSLLYSLEESYGIIEEMGGHQAFIDKHNRLAEYTRDRLRKMGLNILAEKGFESNTVTCFFIDNAKQIRKNIIEKYGIYLAPGRKQYAENTLRITTMGGITKKDINLALLAIEKEVGLQ